MTTTKAGTVPTVAATGKGDHVQGTGTHTHEVDVSSDIAAAIAAHVAKDHATTPPVTPPVTPPLDAKPTITSVTATEATQTSIRISWQLSEPCTGQVEYGKTTGYGTLSARENGLLASHSQVIFGLTVDTTYHFRVRSVDSAGQEVISSDASFKTAASTVVTPPPSGSTVTVSKIADLMTALANNAYGEIVVVDGRYSVSACGSGANNPDSIYSSGLWIGGAYRSRTNPVLVRAATKGGVIFDGGGAGYFGGMNFAAGAHHQTWDGFSFDNGTATETGVLTFGGYPGLLGAHHITMRNITLLPGLHGRDRNHDHGLYFANSTDGGHDLEFYDFDIQATSSTPLSSAYHHDHDPNVYNVRAERWKVKGVYTGVFFYADQKHDITLKDWTIDGCRETGVDLTHPAPNTLFDNIQVTNTPTKFNAPNGTAGLTKVNCNF